MWQSLLVLRVRYIIWTIWYAPYNMVHILRCLVCIFITVPWFCFPLPFVPTVISNRYDCFILLLRVVFNWFCSFKLSRIKSRKPKSIFKPGLKRVWASDWVDTRAVHIGHPYTSLKLPKILTCRSFIAFSKLQQYFSKIGLKIGNQ